MLGRFISRVVAGLSLRRPSVTNSSYSVGTAILVAPGGWTERKRMSEGIILRSADGRQQATISTLSLGADATFDDFKELCRCRIDAEKREVGDGFIETAAPTEEAGEFRMFFYGGNKMTARVFSGHLTLKMKELVIVYVEGVGVAPKDLLESFSVIVSGLKRT
jgi:hypothetical protein